MYLLLDFLLADLLVEMEEVLMEVSGIHFSFPSWLFMLKILILRRRGSRQDGFIVHFEAKLSEITRITEESSWGFVVVFVEGSILTLCGVSVYKGCRRLSGFTV